MGILKNYSAAVSGNRMMANHNTDDIFKNRRAILGAMKCEGPIQEDFVNSKLNESMVDYLEHRSKMNARVSSVNNKMAEVNAMLIEVNQLIMDGNNEIVEFNAANIQINTQLAD